MAVAAASPIAVSDLVIADRSAVHRVEAKTDASPGRILFVKRQLPLKMYPGRLMVKAAKRMPAKISMK
jgi:hypothetical protein